MPEVMIAFCPRRVCPRERNNRAADEQNSTRCFELREFLKRTSESFNGSLAPRRKALIHDIVYRDDFLREPSYTSFIFASPSFVAAISPGWGCPPAIPRRRKFITKLS